MLYKNTLTKIKKGFGRYASLLIIIFVGIGFLAGITVFCTSMENTATKYYEESNLMDFKIVSSVGLSDTDITTLQSVAGIDKVIPSYSLDFLDDNKSLRVHSINDVNKVKLTDGQMPEKNGECIADKNKYKLGDIIHVTSDAHDVLITKEFLVVGLIDSVLYTSDDYGSSTIGTGKLHSFLFINESNFIIDKYTEVYLKIDKNYKAYTDDYNNYSTKIKKELNNLQSKMEEDKVNELREAIIIEVLNTNPSLKDYPEMLEETINNMDIPLVKYTILDRGIVEGYDSLEFDLSKVEIVANTIPALFVLVVILMSLNTMNRMITEERSEMGVLASLGYSNKSILGTYLFYVLSATTIGIIGGYYSGCAIIPRIVYNVFPYTLPPLNIDYSIVNLLIYISVSLLVMFLITLYSCLKELKEKPAILLRPIPPKRGKKIFLEKINFIWKRTSFVWKITLRNIFRYKKRGLMTVTGIACCTALLLIGFGLKDSINNIGQKQYAEIFKYHSTVYLKNETNQYFDELNEMDLINPLLIKQMSFQATTDNKEIDVSLVVPSEVNIFNDYHELIKVKSKMRVKLNEENVIITSKMAEVLNLEVGKFVNVQVNNKEYKIKVDAIVNNYVMNYLYISKNKYKEIFNEDINYNLIVTDFEGNKDEFANKITESNFATNVIFSKDLINQADNFISGLDGVILLIIFIASVLAIIVLYNLTSINISERNREVSTIKVLGFTDSETNKYIYRETFVLTFTGILLGILMGVLLHMYFIPILEGDNISFSKHINWYSYIYTTLIMITFTLIMQVVTYFKLKRINMVESLKSIE